MVITEKWTPQDDLILGWVFSEGYSAVHQGKENRAGDELTVVRKTLFQWT